MLWAFGHALKCFGLQDKILLDPFVSKEEDLGHQGFGVMMDELARQEKQDRVGVESDAKR